MRKSFDESEDDIFGGCGNGVLDILVVKDFDDWSETSENRNPKVCFNQNDWEAVFIDTFHCPSVQPYIEGENIFEHTERNRKLFQQSIPDYPMLGRIFDMYEDYIFNFEEVGKLRQECLKAMPLASSSAANLALRKLIYVCDEAIKDKFYLEFSSD